MNRSCFPEHLREFGDSRSHVRFDRADRTIAQRRDFFVSQAAVHAQEVDFSLLRTQVAQSCLTPQKNESITSSLGQSHGNGCYGKKGTGKGGVPDARVIS
jgi:hypothetical protein